MESLIGDGLIAGVLDITTTELADELVGGFLTAGPDAPDRGRAGRHPAGRLDRRARHGQLLRAGDGPGAVHGPAVLPAQRQRHADADDPGRERARSAPTSPASCRRRQGPVAVLLPRRGVSAIDKAGQPFDDPAARRALHDAIRSGAARRST